MHEKMKMYLAEAREAENVEWLKFVSDGSVSKLDAASQKAVRDLFRHAFSKGWHLGVEKAFEIGTTLAGDETSR